MPGQMEDVDMWALEIGRRKGMTSAQIMLLVSTVIGSRSILVGVRGSNHSPCMNCNTMQPGPCGIEDIPYTILQLVIVPDDVP